jgi:hypothetical protein
MSAPNPDDPLAENVAKHWKDNEQEAIATGGVGGSCRGDPGAPAGPGCLGFEDAGSRRPAARAC